MAPKRKKVVRRAKPARKKAPAKRAIRKGSPERDRILNQLQRAFEGEAWHGPSVLEALEGVTAPRALAKPVPSAHNIWELVHHITAWENIVRRRLEGETFEIPDDVNFPPVRDTSDEAWRCALEALRAGHEKLRAVVARIRDEALDSPPTAKSSARYVLLHGVIQHDIYHAGQISILKKR